MKLLKAWLILLGLIPVAILCLIPVYNFASKRAFERHVAELESMGESLEIADHVPALIENPEDNFAEEPGIREIIKTAREASYDDPGTLQFLDRFDIKHLPEYEMGGRERRVRLIGPAPINDHSPRLTEMEAAEMILAHCSDMEELDALVRAARRPKSNFGLEYEAGFYVDLKEIGVLQDLVGMLVLRARSLLKLGVVDEAASDLETLLRVTEHFDSEPLVIFSLITINVREDAAELIVEGMQEQLWKGSHLTQFDALIPKSGNGVSLSRSMRMERALSVNRILNLKQIAEEAEVSLEKEIKWLSKIPVGFHYDNARVFSDLIQTYKLEEFDSAIVSPIERERSLDSQLTLLRQNPFVKIRYSLATSLLPAYNTIGERYLRSEILMEQAKLAIALEKFHITTGEYPATLSELDVVAPIDPHIGKPMVYRKDGSSYVLYSVGSNQIDEGGLLKHHRDDGDYVWRLELPKGFDRDGYLSRD